MGYIIFVRGNTLWGYRRRILISSGRTLTDCCRNDGTAGREKACSSSLPFCVNEEGLKMAKEEIMAKEEKYCCAATANSHTGETMSGSSCCDCVKHKYRDVNSKEYKSMIRRLKLIEGQVRGIEKMVEEDRYCIDILIQVSAIQSALNAFNKELLAQHIHGCVVDDIRNGKDEVVDELVTAVQKLMK